MTDSRTRPTPPKPRLAFRIGVTGHRANRLAPEAVTRLRGRLRDLFSHITSEIDAIAESHRELFSDAAPLIRIVSPLAEGSDRLVARVGLEMGFELTVLLPFAREDYEEDFIEPGSKREFRDLLAAAERSRSVLELAGPRAFDESDDLAYQAIGVMTLRQCDLLIAIWDGQPQAGRGGTGEVVERASESGIPVVWLESGGDAPPHLISTKDERVSISTLKDRAPPLDSQALKAELRRLLLPAGWPAHRAPSSPKSVWSSINASLGHLFGSHGETAALVERLPEFYSETEHQKIPVPIYRYLLAFLGIRRGKATDLLLEPYQISTRNAWRAYLDGLEQMAIAGKERITEILLPRFSWADGLGVYYAHVYRNSYIANFLLAALAVGMAALTLVLPHEFKAPLVLVELAFIGSIVAITIVGANRRWHQRWIDYRHLAELLRHMRVLILTASSTAEMHPAHAESDTDPGASWVNWYYRATVRELGIVGLRADAAYAAKAVALSAETELSEQIRYHRANRTTIEAAGHRLDLMGAAAFVLTAATCLAFLVAGAPHEAGYAVTALTAFLPAFGAAMLGIRFQGDFASVASQSEAMVRKLLALESRLLKAAKTPDCTLALASKLIEDATETIVAEVTDWRFMFRGKPLTLPS